MLFLKHCKSGETIWETGRKYNIHPNQISTWKRQFLSDVKNILEKGILKADEEKNSKCIEKNNEN